MNRTALCIQMLNLLKSRGLMSREALATELQTNIRNIAEYRKELETAGYYIETVSGVYGGYRLMDDALLPVPVLSTKEKRGLKEASQYLYSHPDFRYGHDFQSAIDKIQAGIHNVESTKDIYLEAKGKVSDAIQLLLHTCEKAIAQNHEVVFTYKSMHAESYEQVRVHPYEILNYQLAYYCLGYSLKAKDYRIYKFSSARMRDCVMSDHVFQRDSDFRLRDHIGEMGLIKNHVHELELTISGEDALLIAEQPPGIHHEMKWLANKQLYIHLFMSGDVAVRMFLLSLGDHVIIHEPKQWADKIKEIAVNICKTK